ncbi:unnamed protein product [Leptidea sinapis]|uniref:Glucose-methanol-choline oxidoreductase N-terminal domain-containing protein n=1 Tax=Leptidea sinapis TaxID=189913 RepID=A0A5E4Q2D5_9NEOP|nr:unnamed protein product [Leptidea sinapis]
MQWTLILTISLSVISLTTSQTNNIFDFWTDLFRPLPHAKKEGFVPDYTPKNNQKFDFIIVGAGSAGCVLANRLSEISDWNVLLLEAGGNENFFSDIPIFAPFISITPMNWDYSSEPEKRACKDLRGNVCYMPRGKVLGGSSVLNFLIYQRGHPEDYDDWEDMGNEGWSYKDVLPYFKKSENIRIPELYNSSFHGKGGYLDIDYASYSSPLETAFKDAGQELGYTWNDPNGENLIGFSKPQATIRNGRRCSSSKAFLEPIRYRKNLKVSKYSTAKKLLIDPLSKIAYGVEFTKKSKRLRVYARNEIILAAGTVGSAQLLMLSGIGPADHLNEIGIEPIINLPVGYNLQDHVTFSGNAFIVNETGLCVSDMIAASPMSAAAYLAGHGPLTIPGGAAGLAFSHTKYSNDLSDSRPDIEIVMGAGSLAGDFLGIIRSLLGVTDEFYLKVYGSLPIQKRQQSFALNPVLIRPRSIGRLTLRSSNFDEHPKIQPNYFDNSNDMKIIIEGAQKIINTKSFQKYDTKLHDVPFPGCEDLVGTCKMGPADDPTAVVSPRLQVHGAKGLRIADASIMPRIPASHTHAPVVMIAEKAADMIKEDWDKPIFKIS